MHHLPSLLDPYPHPPACPELDSMLAGNDFQFSRSLRIRGRGSPREYDSDLRHCAERTHKPQNNWD